MLIQNVLFKSFLSEHQNSKSVHLALLKPILIKVIQLSSQSINLLHSNMSIWHNMLFKLFLYEYVDSKFLIYRTIYCSTTCKSICFVWMKAIYFVFVSDVTSCNQLASYVHFYLSYHIYEDTRTHKKSDWPAIFHVMHPWSTIVCLSQKDTWTKASY